MMALREFEARIACLLTTDIKHDMGIKSRRNVAKITMERN